MSYVLIPYLVDISKLRTIVGGKDTSLLQAVIAKTSSESDGEDDEYQMNDEVEEAIYQLIMGEEKYPVDAYQFGYALKEICSYYGEGLHADNWCGVRWAAIEACGLEELLTETGSPVELPPYSDGPLIGKIGREEVGNYLQAARARRKASEDSNVRELLDEYIGWLETAANKDLDLVLFYH